MSATQAKVMAPPQSATARPFRLNKILLAHDASKASEQALADATTLARRFGAEILLAHVQSPEVTPLNGFAQSHSEKAYAEAELKEIEGRLAQSGVRCREIVRMGAVGDTIANLCVEEDVGLVMLEAYGRESQDRHSLGSTAEHLLSTLPCPAMVYGPSVKFPLVVEEHDRSALFAVLLPVSATKLRMAVQIAQAFEVPLEVLHVTDTVTPIARLRLEEECRGVALLLSGAGVKSSWSVLTGQPWKVIVKQSTRVASPFVLLPLKYGHVMAGDDVAAHVIRASGVPVLTYSDRS